MSVFSLQVDASLPYPMLWFLCIMWRFFSNGEVWRAFMDIGAVSFDAEPKWDRVSAVLYAFDKVGVSYFGGLYYTGNYLKQYRWRVSDVWSSCKTDRISKVAGHVLALKLVWMVVNKYALQLRGLQLNPSRDGFRMCTLHLYESIRSHTIGLFGDYSMKISLDAILVAQPKLDRVVSWWPMCCPAYTKQLPLLFPFLEEKQEQLFVAAVCLHRAMQSPGRKMTLGDVLAQLCWLECDVQ